MLNYINKGGSVAKKNLLRLFKMLVALLFLYKTMLVWGILLRIPVFLLLSSIYTQTSFAHLVIISIIYPIVAVGLWLVTDWGVLLCFISMLLDGACWCYNSNINNFYFLLNLFIYALIFLTYCCYKIINIYRNITI